MRKSIQFVVLLALLLSIKHVGSLNQYRMCCRTQALNRVAFLRGLPTTLKLETVHECQRSPGTDDIVRCTEQGALLRYGFCMTYEEGQGTFVGRCQSFEVQGHINMCPKNLQGSYLSQQISQSSISTCMCGPLAIQSLMAFWIDFGSLYAVWCWEGGPSMSRGTACGRHRCRCIIHALMVRGNVQGDCLWQAQMPLHYPCTDGERQCPGGLLAAGTDASACIIHAPMLIRGTINVQGDCLWQAYRWYSHTFAFTDSGWSMQVMPEVEK